MPAAPLHDGAAALALATRCAHAGRRRRQPLARVPLSLMLALGAVATAALLAGVWPAQLRAALVVLDRMRWPLALLVGAVAWSRLRALRQGLQHAHERGWLAAAPIARHALLAHWRRSLLRHGLGACGLVLAVATLCALRCALDLRALLTTVGIACALGAGGGWRHGAAAVPAAPMPPRLRSAAVTTACVADGAPLRRWAFACWLAAAQPRREAQLLAPMLLALPASTGFASGLRLLAALVVLVAAQGLLRATTTAIGQAAGFLRSTPLPATRLAWQLLPRPLLVQGGLAASLALLIAPQRPLAAAGIAALWLLPCALWLGAACRRYGMGRA